MNQILFRNFNFLDPEDEETRGGYELLVEGDTVKELSSRPIRADNALTIDCGRRTLMPGLIDCHVHVFLSEVNIRNLEGIPLTLMTARAIDVLRGMIDRGFTTVRDTGGADWGIKTAVEHGLVVGPRLFIAGQAIGPTGGSSEAPGRTACGSARPCCQPPSSPSATSDG